LGDPSDPLSLNRYVYCGLDPVNYVDPTGFEGEIIQAGESLMPLAESFGPYGVAALELLDLGIMGFQMIAEALCFTEDTPIYTKDGHKLIKDIHVGDEVYSESPETGEKGLKKVTNIFVKETQTLIHVFVGNTEIKATLTHPFWVVGKGWVEARKLVTEDKLLLYSGKIATVTAIKLEQLLKPIKVYNFEVEGWHTYFVSKSYILVHNSCGRGNVKFPDARQLERMLGASKGSWHDIKDKILSDLTRKDSSYKDAMKKVGNNPDIGVDAQGNVVVRSRDGKVTVSTDEKIESYSPSGSE
jgi:hypothetical protein